MKNRDGNKVLGQYVRERREAQGMSVRDATSACGLNDAYWRKLEQGIYMSPDAKTLRLIAKSIGCPLEDLYGLAGYTVANDLPALTPYLRSRYDLPAEAVTEMERYFDLLRNYYGIAPDQPVFPPTAPSEASHRHGVPTVGAKNAKNHPWRAAQNRRAS